MLNSSSLPRRFIVDLLGVGLSEELMKCFRDVVRDYENPIGPIYSFIGFRLKESHFEQALYTTVVDAGSRPAFPAVINPTKGRLFPFVKIAKILQRTLAIQRFCLLFQSACFLALQSFPLGIFNLRGRSLFFCCKSFGFGSFRSLRLIAGYSLLSPVRSDYSSERVKNNCDQIPKSKCSEVPNCDVRCVGQIARSSQENCARQRQGQCKGGLPRQLEQIGNRSRIHASPLVKQGTLA